MARGLKGILARILAGSRRLRVLVAIGLAVVLLGAGLLQLYPLVERKANVESAATTEGTVTSVETFKNQYEITYEYTVDGRTYEGDRVFPGPFAPGGTASPEVIGQIQTIDKGETTVHYLPGNPDYAWLITRDHVVSRHIVYFVVAGLVAVLLLAFVYVDLKSARTPSAGGGGPGAGAAQFEQMASMMQEYDPQNPPSEAEMRERFEEQVGGQQPGVGTGAGGQGMSGASGAAGLFATFGRIFRLLKSAALVFALGAVLLLGSGFLLLQFLTP